MLGLRLLHLCSPLCAPTRSHDHQAPRFPTPTGQLYGPQAQGPAQGPACCGACAACSHADGNAYTSEAGSDYCTVPWLDNSCGNGTTWDAVALACADCPAGTKRGPSDSTCLTCAAGTYAAPGSTSCTACAANTVAPSSGSASCTACPLGSVAVSGTSCSAW